MNKLFLIFTLSFLLVGLGSQSFAQTSEKLVVIETNLGEIVIEFFPEDAPNHVDNFIGLTESGYYDGVLFHRIIPDFMIQGGDPNTISGDPSTWGQGGPTERVNAEFNDIKHNRGIVSMARAADPNSGGSQFFIVHKDSNFLDEQYTVFGRIVTDESFVTLDTIAAVQTRPNDAPVEPEQVRITKASVVNRSDFFHLLDLGDPERTGSTPTPSTGNQKYESPEHEVAFSAPEGWLLQTPDKTEENSPDVVAVGPKVGVMNPVISLTVQETNGRTLDQLISEKEATLQDVIEQGSLNIISSGKGNVNGIESFEILAEGYFSANGENFNVKFREVMIYDTEKFYTLAYSNGLGQFNSQLPRFEDTVNSFEILSKDDSATTGDIITPTNIDNSSDEEGGGCLIATATFGSELAPQVQQLRELRDNSLLQTHSGTAFMTGFNQFYYSFSPTIADMEREHPAFKEFVKITITPMLSTLSIMEHADSEAEVLGYGIGVILMNLGMYIAAPAIVIYKIRKF